MKSNNVISIVLCALFTLVIPRSLDEHQQRLLSDPAYIQAAVIGSVGATIEEEKCTHDGIDYVVIQSSAVLNAPPWVQKVASYVEAKQTLQLEEKKYEENRSQFTEYKKSPSPCTLLFCEEPLRQLQPLVVPEHETFNPPPHSRTPPSISYAPKPFFKVPLHESKNDGVTVGVARNYGNYYLEKRRSLHEQSIPIDRDLLLYGQPNCDAKKIYKNKTNAEFETLLQTGYNNLGSQLGFDSFHDFIFNNFWLYRFNQFMEIARSLQGWEEFIEDLHKRLETDKEFDFTTRRIPGFEEGELLARAKHTLGKGLAKVNKKLRLKAGISKFHKHINKEKDRVEQIRNDRQKRVQYKQEQRLAQEAQRLERDREQYERKLREALAEKKRIQNEWLNFDESKTRSALLLDKEHAYQELEEYADIFSHYSSLQTNEENQLADTAWHSFYEARYALENSNAHAYERAQKRLEALTHTLVSDNQTVTTSYNLTNQASAHLEKLSLNSGNFTLVTGTDLQQCIHEELVDTINQTSGLVSAFGDNFHINSFGTLIYGSAEQGRLCNEAGNTAQSMNFSNWCDSLLQVGRGYAKLASEGFDLALGTLNKGASIIKEGVTKGFSSSADQIKQFLNAVTENPSEAAQEVLSHLGGAALALGKLVIQTLVDPTIIPNGAAAIFETLKSMPKRELAVNSVALATELLLSTCVVSNITSQVAPLAALAKQFATTAQIETTLAAGYAFKSNDARRILAPLSSTYTDGLKIAHPLMQAEPEAIKSTLAVCNLYPEISHSPKELKDVIHILSINKEGFTWKGFIHIFKGDTVIKDGQIKLQGGMHTQRAFDHLIKLGKLDINDFKIYKFKNGAIGISIPAKVFKKESLAEKIAINLPNGERITGIKTLWPPKYEQPKVLLEEITYILSNPNNKIDKRKFVGMTRDGIKAVVWLDENERVITAYPEWEI